MNNSKKTCLFDLDGVIVDTESYYDKFWGEKGLEHLKIKDFCKIIKGSTLVNLLNQHFPKELHEKLTEEVTNLDDIMPYEYIPGAIEFLRLLKEKGYKIAVVTSSSDRKMNSVYKMKPELKTIFDFFVTSNKVTKSKPDPQCYLLAAQELQAKPEDCLVFEDSFFGLEAGRNAGMKVIGLATTNSQEAIKSYCDIVIDNFVNVKIEDLI